MRLLKKEKIFKDIVYFILSENLQVGDRIPTESEFCEKFSVSRITLRNAIDRLVNQGILERKGRNGTILTGIPTASNVPSGADTQKKILFVYFSSSQKTSFLDDSGTTPEQMYLGSEKCINEKNDVIMVQNGENFIKTNRSLLNSVDGVIIGGNIPEEVLGKLTKASIPFVFIDYPSPLNYCDTVFADQFEAGYLACKKIKDKKTVKNILFLGLMFDQEERLQIGYRESLSGVVEYVYEEEGETTIFNHDIKLSEDKTSAVERMVRYIEENSIDGIVACSNLLEEYLKFYVEQAGDKLPICIITPEPLKNENNRFLSVSLNVRKLGYIAASRLYERFVNPEKQVLRMTIPID